MPYLNKLILVALVLLSLFLSIRRESVALQDLPPITYPQETSEPVVNDSVARFANDTCFVGLLIRPNEVSIGGVAVVAPYGYLMPDELTLSKLIDFDVEELVLLGSPAPLADAQGHSGSRIQWAVAAQLGSEPELEQVLATWTRPVAFQNAETAPSVQEVAIGDERCFRVPAGTFFPPSLFSRSLSFADREGKYSENGINAGDVYSYRGYVAGGTKSFAVFTFDSVSKSQLLNGYLPLELRLNVLKTLDSVGEFATGLIELRNPDTGVRSAPIEFTASSFESHLIYVPRLLDAADQEGFEKLDLMDDLVSSGRIEVVLRSNQPRVYLGVGEWDLAIRSVGFEYLWLSEREVLVAQSASQLEEMLGGSLKASWLSSQLNQAEMLAVLAAGPIDERNRPALEEWIEPISIPTITHLSESATRLTVTCKNELLILFEIAASLTSPEAAERVERLVEDVILQTLEGAQVHLPHILGKNDAFKALLARVFPGYTGRFPEPEVLSVQHRSDQLTLMLDSLLRFPEVRRNENAFALRFALPADPKDFSSSTRIAIANLEEWIGHDLFNRKRFKQCDEVVALVTRQFPDVSEAWIHRAHQLTFNVPREIDGHLRKYRWVRRGFHVLLDGIERNPKSVDLIWMLAEFIARGIGAETRPAEYRTFFAGDTELHDRLAEHIDLDLASNIDGQIDNWLVAKELFERGDILYADGGTLSSIHNLLVSSRPALCQALYAQEMSSAANWAEAQLAWKSAGEMFRAVGNVGWADPSGSLKLDDYDSMLQEHGDNDERVDWLRRCRDLVDYEYWIARCELEQSQRMARFRLLCSQGKALGRQSRFREAAELYSEAFDLLAELYKSHTHELQLIAGDLKWEAAQYQRVIDETGLTNSSHETLLQLIDDSEAFGGEPFP